MAGVLGWLQESTQGKFTGIDVLTTDDNKGKPFELIDKVTLMVLRMCQDSANEAVQQERQQSFNVLLTEISEWARKTFPEQSGHSISNHLYREAKELLAIPNDPEEMADVIMLVADLADYYGIDLKEAVRKKFEICKARTWGEPDSEGVYEHVESDN